MPHISKSATVTATTTAGGAATVYLGPFTGELIALIYTKVDFDNGVDLTITGEDTAQAIATLTNQDASKTWYPRATAQGLTGSDLAAGDIGGGVMIPLANERIKIVVASGGNVKTGKFQAIVAGAGGVGAAS